MGRRPYRHYSFILSLWTEEDAGSGSPAAWRYSLEDPHRSQRHGFKDLTGLIRFLEEWTTRAPEELPIDSTERK